MNVAYLYSYARRLANEAWNDNFINDVKKLLAFILKIDNAEELPLHRNKTISIKQFTQFKKILKRKIDSEPIAYITGKKSFWKHDFIVNKNVLIPRPETELIIETALTKFDIYAKLKILDLGTGCGCLAISLQHEFINAQVEAIDISKKALAVTQQNINKFNLEDIKLHHGNWFEPLENSKKFHLIVANPPYISINDWHNLDKNVLSYEPKIALTDYDDGLLHYQNIISQAANYMTQTGILILEIGK